MQNLVGNQRTASFLEHREGVAQVSQARVQRQGNPAPQTANPVAVSDDPDTQKAMQEQSDAMMTRFPEVARGFCRDWFESATAALSTAPEPDDPFAARNYWVALAGNMVWAATALTGALIEPPAAVAAASVGASAVGAGAGSGALAKAAPPSGKAAVMDKLATMRGQMEARATQRGFFVDVVTAATADPKTRGDQNAQDELLWKKICDGKFAFAERIALMTTNLRATVASHLVEFQTQFLAWKQRQDVIKKARDYELDEESSGPFGDPIDIIGDLLGIGTPADRFFEMAMKDIPFEPKFTSSS
jgi:hypothetical protein